MARTAFATEKMKRECLIAAAAAQGHPILCAICRKPILPGQKVAYDHGHSIGRNGPNTVANLFPVHDEKTGELNCHTRKTSHPRGPHTSIGGDTHEAAKTNRLAAETAQHNAVMAGEVERPASRLRSRGFGEQSRPMSGGRKSEWKRPLDPRKPPERRAS